MKSSFTMDSELEESFIYPVISTPSNYDLKWIAEGNTVSTNVVIYMEEVYGLQQAQ